MKIRSITVFINPGWPLQSEPLEQAGKLIAAAREAFTQAGYTVQTVRLATVPFPELIGQGSPGKLLRLAEAIEQAALAAGFEYVSLGPALPDSPNSYAVIPDALAATESAFFSGLMTLTGGKVSLPAVRRCAQVIHQAAPLSADGFTNLRFAALANVPAGSPFFPAAYHQGSAPAFALATEAADLTVEAFTNSASLEEACQALIDQVEEHARTLERTAHALETEHATRFGGIDFSLAPFPEIAASLGEAVERLGVPAIGLHGSLGAAALITSTLDRARFPRAGFSGLFLPVLEDAVLARRAAEGVLSVTDLLLYSAVCGTGLDTIPLPGDTPVEALEAVLLDLAVLAQRLDKPLTARLMPIPGKRVGEPTGFDFTYFANSQVMALKAGPLGHFLASDATLTVRPRD